ncbi:glycoside hydrolase family 127 protein [Stigmatella sp. ncwal1]|uniref:Glycoside hydrolase family 127 protein n=1 Tax=Stigmatella ashevillensis TaxID=2995309 RepID=A0ABT5D1L8_9BACT|nr:RICIN domain-containing protein [Stigmatella ashevillena]MDC0707561.1 glycoside hydrolase family 127 protein [Stigmatella ashevillena]
MKIDRRELIKGGLAAAGAAMVASPSEAQAAAAAVYMINRSPLRPDAFLRLPPGAVRPQGWLATQLERQVNGLCGRFMEVSHFLQYDNTGWTRPNLGGWEEVTYWLRGYVDLGYVTGNATVLSTASRWINGVLATQASDGFFGPTALRTSLNGHADVWPHMPMLQALRAHAEYTGDSRIIPFLTRFFSYLNAQPTGVFRDGWGTWRWGDAIDVIYWLYNHTGDTFLLDLVRKIHSNSANWTDGLPNLHNVNIAQGFREPAQYGVLSGEARHRTASYDRYNDVQARFGQFPGGGFAGDENIRAGLVDPRQGFETCGIVEYMLSHELLNRITGDPVWADRVEDLAFNSLPASLDPLGRSIHYVTSANSIDLDNVPKTLGQFQNGFAMQSYKSGIDEYRCCPHNYGMGWPYFVEEMWLATPDGGLCAAMYGPCTVTATVSGGVRVTLTENTHYPFTDTVTLSLSMTGTATFPLQLRIPAWCTAPELRINGATVPVSGGPRYASTTRTWANGDTVTLRLPMRPTVRTWPAQHNAVSVNHGPLTFSLRITENWVQTGGSAQWPQYDVHAGSAWNYGLVPGAAISVTTGVGNLADPFTPANAPIRLTTNGQRIDGWQADSQHVVTPLQDGPIATPTPVEAVTLIPMGAARLRITSFPQTGGTRAWVPQGANYRLQNRHSGKVLGVDGMSNADSANVVQFDDNGTADHLWRIIDAGGGFVKLQNVNSSKVLAVENMSTANSARVQQFSDVGSADHRWQLIDSGNGWMRLRNGNSGKVLGVSGMSTANSAQAVQFDDSGTADHDWRLIPDGQLKIQNVHSGKVLAVENMSTANSARVQQFSDVGSADHQWAFLPDANGYFRIRNVNSGKVLGVAGMSTADSAQVVQFDDTGTADHLWRIRVNTGGNGSVRIQNANSGKVLAVHNASTADSANVEQYQDNGTPDHNWLIR